MFQPSRNVLREKVVFQERHSPNSEGVSPWFFEAHNLSDLGLTRVKDYDLANPVVGRAQGLAVGTQGFRNY